MYYFIDLFIENKMQRKKNQSPLKKLVENHESQKNLFITDLPDDFGIGIK